ncbi:hypothetical protein ASPZODRAFT_16131 [Penicilliopsis zonata CBS 506.65]|uniref:Uncharacterized protein n=1 Tax=Penicilliopsis zonata CBS 506.65 TaxID=1073090 RepID=A0A1L9SGK1_9EURO|nr:hypothetical protein ASPZODRAFT_16131 [Penicilliopsis zonata CBS 506.65]OJJ46360.1 hypothetical protein ASPZODRAFT_16131 [Penicilliopsis zonata CBS 506.65]
MSTSPAKRRKTSETTAVPVDASQSNRHAVESNRRARPSSRQSFQSPTRASLAKSHPEVLARATSRIPTRIPQPSKNNYGTTGSQDGEKEQVDARVFGLRDRKALRPSLSSTASPTKGPAAITLSPRRRSGGIQAFTAPPRRVSRRIGPTDIIFGTPPTSQLAPEPTESNTPENQLFQGLASVTNESEQGLDTGISSLPEGFGEPDLPPTPTQLGLEEPPGRPQGLLSSSPSKRPERRVRGLTAEDRGLGFLKPKSTIAGDNQRLKAEDERTFVSETILEKQKLRKQLSDDLQRLKDDITELEKWTRRSQESVRDGKPGEADLYSLMSLLASDDPTYQQHAESQPDNTSFSSLIFSLLPFSPIEPPKPSHETSPFPSNPFALQKASQTRPYLTAFAPLNLKAHSNKASMSESDVLIETHTLTLSPPPPFPSNLFNVSVVYRTQPETLSLVNKSLSILLSDEASRIPEDLQSWVNTRLANPLLQLDVSGLCWGINRYWEASISRARMWAEIERKHSKFVEGRTNPNGTRRGSAESDETALTPHNLRLLLPHIERSSVLFSSSDKSRKMLLTCSLILDEWTGEPQLASEISVHGPASTGKRKIEQEAKKLFRALLSEGERVNNEMDTIVRATGAVLNLLFSVGSKELSS